MKKSTRAVVAFGVAGALALGATPAYAAPYSGANIEFGDLAGSEWTWDTFTDGSLEGLWNDAWISGPDNETWDSTEVQVGGSDDTYTTVGCADPADLSDAADASGDKIVLCDPEDITTVDGVITAQLEFRFYADHKSVRTRLILSNETTAAISGGRVYMNYNAYQDEETNVYASTTQAPQYTDPMTLSTINITPDDFVWVTDDRNDWNNPPVAKYAVARAGSAVMPANDSANNMVSGGMGQGGADIDNTNSYFAVPTLAAGESVEFVTMAQVYLFVVGDGSGGLDGWEYAVKQADEAAWADTTIDSDALVFAGIDDKSKVLNWSPVSTPELPNTGVDAAGFAGLAIALLVAGAGVVVVRRRARA